MKNNLWFNTAFFVGSLSKAVCLKNDPEAGTSVQCAERSKLMVLMFIISIISGALLPLAFAPLNFWPLGLLSPALQLALWQNRQVTPKRAFWLGWGYGLGMFGVGVSWVFVSIHRFGNTEVPLAVLITTILVTFLALFPALQGYFLKRYFRGSRAQLYFLGFPSLWVLFEWLRSIAFTGFPWLFLGYTQLETPLSGFAPLFSVYGVSFAVALSAGALMAVVGGIKDRSSPVNKGLLILCLLWGGGQLLTIPQWTQNFGRLYTVSLVQGNIPLLQKFNQKDPFVALENSYGKLTQPYLGRDLILWPESAIPIPLPHSKAYLEKLSQQIKNHGSTLIAGIQVINGKREYHNSLIALGNGHGLYHKHHLLPYGDYLPFESKLRGLINFFDLPMSSFSPGSKHQASITAGALELNPNICYEIAFPELVRDTLGKAEAIITLSEDGWFGDSWGPHQHLQIARMRALETGRPVLRATTSGITAIIDSKGKLQATIPQFQAGVLDGSFQPMQGRTPWMILGLWPWLGLLLLAFLLPGRVVRRYHGGR